MVSVYTWYIIVLHLGPCASVCVACTTSQHKQLQELLLPNSLELLPMASVSRWKAYAELPSWNQPTVRPDAPADAPGEGEYVQVTLWSLPRSTLEAMARSLGKACLRPKALFLDLNHSARRPHVLVEVGAYLISPLFAADASAVRVCSSHTLLSLKAITIEPQYNAVSHAELISLYKMRPHVRSL